MKSEPAVLAVPAGRELFANACGGFAAMLVALPSAIAYGVAIYGVLGPRFLGEGALAGIAGTVVLGIVAPLLGGSPRLVSSPSAPAAAVMTTFAARMFLGNGAVAGQPAGHVLFLLLLTSLMAGSLQVLYGMAGAGRLIKYIPYPVISGFISGVGVLILINQMPNLFGFSKDLDVLAGLASPSAWQWSSVIVAAFTIGGVVIAPRLSSAIPPMIFGLSAGMLAYLGVATLGLPYFRVDAAHFVVGPVSGGISSIVAMATEHWTALGELKLSELAVVIAPAITLSIVLSVDTLKTCVIVDALTHTRHNSNRELFGQGVANAASALAGGLPGSGTSGATLVNVQSGGSTGLSGVLAGFFALTTFLLLGRAISGIPVAVLAGIVAIVAARMIDRNSLYLLRRRSTVPDFLVIVAVTVVAIRFDLIIAGAVGLGLSILLFMREQIRGSVIRKKLHGGQISSKRQRLRAEKEILEKNGASITVCQLQGSLFFGTTDQLFEELAGDLKRSRCVILEMSRVQSVDFTAVHMLNEIGATLKDRGGCLIFADVPALLPTGQDLEAYFKQLEAIVPGIHVSKFDTLDEALEWAEDSILKGATVAISGDESPLLLHEIELLRGIDAKALELLSRCAELRSYKPGEVIFRSDDTGDELFLIRNGEVRIVLPMNGHRRYNLTSFGRGDFFGDMAFLDKGRRSADAVAATDTGVFAISRGRFDETARQLPDLGADVFARLSQALAIRLRYANSELRSARDA